MIVHLTGSSRDSGEDLQYLRQIISTIYENDVEIAHNWVETSNLTVKNQHQEVWDWDRIVAENMAAIKRSDAVIVEVTSYAFFQGYQIAIALSQNKPVLAVSRRPLDDLAIAGITDNLLTKREYKNATELNDIVSTFIQIYFVTPKDKELSVLLDADLNSYLRAEKEKTGKGRDELLLELAKSGLGK